MMPPILIIMLFITCFCIDCWLLAAAATLVQHLRRAPKPSRVTATPIDETNYQSHCESCKQDFNWKETDALVKYAPGNGYMVACPHCAHLMHISDEY